MRMNIIQTVFAGLLLAGFFQCLSADGAQSLPVRTLAKGAFSGIRNAREEIVTSAEEWEKLWKQHATSGGAAEKVPAVDFTREMVIIATMGAKPTGGYAIEIVSADVHGRNLRISVRRTSPPPGAITIQAFTAPFHFAAVPRRKLKPEFTDAADGAKEK